MNVKTHQPLFMGLPFRVDQKTGSRPLARVYHTTDPDVAIRELQKSFKEHKVLEQEGRANGKKPVAFITRGKQGAAVVTDDAIHYVAAAEIPKESIVNTLGAGDTSFAGFLAGYVLGLPHQTSARLGMILAGAKLRENGPRLKDPEAALRSGSPRLADEAFSKISGRMRASAGTERDHMGRY